MKRKRLPQQKYLYSYNPHDVHLRCHPLQQWSPFQSGPCPRCCVRPHLPPLQVPHPWTCPSACVPLSPPCPTTTQGTPIWLMTIQTYLWKEMRTSIKAEMMEMFLGLRLTAEYRSKKKKPLKMGHQMVTVERMYSGPGKENRIIFNSSSTNSQHMPVFKELKRCVHRATNTFSSFIQPISSSKSSTLLSLSMSSLLYSFQYKL